MARKEIGRALAQDAVGELLSRIRICAIDATVVRAAHSLQWSDYEDAVQHASATASGIEAIVTRNLNHYKNATLPIFSPAAFLVQLPT